MGLVGRPAVGPAHTPAALHLTCPSRTRRAPATAEPQTRSLLPLYLTWSVKASQRWTPSTPGVFSQVQINLIVGMFINQTKHNKVISVQPVTSGKAGSCDARQACCLVPFPASSVEQDAFWRKRAVCAMEQVFSGYPASGLIISFVLIN